jgi:hypothetical protein
MLSPGRQSGSDRKATVGLIAVVAMALFLRLTGDEGMAQEINTKNFEIAGITLGVSTGQDVEQILGPAPRVDTPDHEGVRSCYLSAAGDGAVLEIESWVGSVIQFRLDSRPNATEVNCAKSPLVSRKLATGTGLKLGLLRKQVIAILGQPTAVKGARLEYEESFDRPLTTQEKLRLKQSGPPWDVNSIHVMNRIYLTLSEGKVVSISVLHNETD